MHTRIQRKADDKRRQTAAARPALRTSPGEAGAMRSLSAMIDGSPMMQSQLAMRDHADAYSARSIAGGAAPVQAKLSIGKPGDKYEQEADRVGNAVVDKIHSASGPVAGSAGEALQRQLAEGDVRMAAEEEEVQMKGEEEEVQMKGEEEEVQMKGEEEEVQMKGEEEEVQMKAEEEVQMKGEEEEVQMKGEEEEVQMKSEARASDGLAIQRKKGEGGQTTEGFQQTVDRSRGGGKPLDPRLQSSMGTAMGADFSKVRIHADAQSDSLSKAIQAKAFTTGSDVFFKKGAYDPSGRSGQQLIAHELTHVVQQGAAGSRASRAEE